MKKIFAIILLVLLSQSIFAQEKTEYKDLYILSDSESFTGELLRYRAIFYVKSEDERFSHDNYYFDINYHDLNDIPLYKLGKLIDINTIDYINSKDFFKAKSNCELHEELSLMHKNGTRIFIISKLPDSNLLRKEGVIDNDYKTDEYMVWFANYSGTRKDVMHTQMGRGYFY